MTRGARFEFRQLERVFSGYLHEDFAVQYGTPEAALRAFRTDASPSEWRRFQREATRLLELLNEQDFDHVCQVLEQLGSRWIPSSRTALVAVLTAAQM